jgi:glycerate dehydrogenase
LPKLQFIAVLATGSNIVDLAAARERGIPVSNVPTYGTRSVAQMAMAHLLNLTQHVGEHAAGVCQGRWTQNADWCYWDYPLVELDGLMLGLVGLGRIGRAMAQLAQAFGMRVQAYDVATAAPPEGVELVDLETVFRTSDVVSLHCPLTADNRHLVNAERLNLMKPTAFLINTSRGPLVDEEALADALRSDRIAAAGLDVLSQEPPPAGHPLLGLKNCYLTPHNAWATRRARERLLAIVVENVRAFMAGKPQNVVN